MPEEDVIARALADLRTRQPLYQLYADYFDGNHRLAFATEKFRNAFGSLFAAFADNNCPVVIDAVADRLTLTGFGVEIADEDATDGPASTAWDIWQANRMDQRSGEVHLEALRSGDAYVIVWPDADNRPVIYPNRAAQVIVHYDDEVIDRINWAAKVWLTEERYYRVNVYYPDRIEKYVTRSTPTDNVTPTLPEKAEAFVQHEVEGEPWPLPNPYGIVPVFHFPNNSDIGHFGRSELKNVIPIQDALNKSISDMLVAMEFVAVPQRWATGLSVEVDESTGKIRPPFEAGVDRIWATEASDVNFGEFRAADLTHFIQVSEMFRMSIARVSGTPMHYMLINPANFPSGEALKTATDRFTAKVKHRQQAFGNVWENVLRFCLLIAEGEQHRDLQLSATWRDPTPRSDKDFVEQLVQKREKLDVPRVTIWDELGYTEDQRARMEELLDAESVEHVARLLRSDQVAGSLLDQPDNLQAAALVDAALARGE